MNTYNPALFPFTYLNWQTLNASGTLHATMPISISELSVFQLSTGAEVGNFSGESAGSGVSLPLAIFQPNQPYAIVGRIADGRMHAFSAFQITGSPAATEIIPFDVYWSDGANDLPSAELVTYQSPTEGCAISQFADLHRTVQFITHNAFACAGDLNADALVDDSDFSIFVVAYDQLICDPPADPTSCPSDFTGDGNVDDADFVIFVWAYDALICP